MPNDNPQSTTAPRVVADQSISDDTSPNRARGAASQYLKRRWGVRASVSTLAKYAVLGAGPELLYDGRFPIYTEESLDTWAKARISGPFRSTTERDQHRQSQNGTVHTEVAAHDDESGDDE